MFSIHQGEFANDLYEGKGVYRWADGSSYEGHWTNSTCDCIGIKLHSLCFTLMFTTSMAGEGKYTDKTGVSWLGSFSGAVGCALQVQLT